VIKENQSFKVETREKKGCLLEVTVEVKPEQVKRAYKQAVKTINKEISVPGFRKGKAPDEAVIKQYGPHIEKEWKDILVNDALQGTLELTKIYPYNKNSIQRPKIEKCSLEAGALVQLSYECFPQIPEVNFSSIKLPKMKRELLADNAVEDVLQEIQKAHCNWEEVAPRPVQAGDHVDITIAKIDEEPAKELIKDRRFEISDNMMSWLKKMLLGMEVGQSREGYTEPDEKAPPTNEPFQAFQVRVTLNGIKKSIPAPVDDELAKKVGASSKEDLIAKITENLESDLEAKLREKKMHALEDALLEQYPFDLPKSLLDSEVKHRYDDKVNKMREEGLSEDSIAEQAESIRKEVETASDNALRMHFLLNHIAEAEKIVLTQEELSDRLRGEMMQNPQLFDMQKKNPEMFGNIVRRLSNHYLFEKIRDHVLTKVAA
jgi:trigger factor